MSLKIGDLVWESNEDALFLVVSTEILESNFTCEVFPLDDWVYGPPHIRVWYVAHKVNDDRDRYCPYNHYLIAQGS